MKLLPEDIGCCSNLNSINAYDSELTGLPESIKELAKL